MNRQIGQLTSTVKARTEKMSNSKEGNDEDVLNSETSTRSDNSTLVEQGPESLPVFRVEKDPKSLFWWNKPELLCCAKWTKTNVHCGVTYMLLSLNDF